jgi:hypothetical protein
LSGSPFRRKRRSEISILCLFVYFYSPSLFVALFFVTKMTEAGGAKKASNPEADAKNWEQRLKSEGEAPHRWNEAWGSLFDNGIPHEYDKRIAYYQEVLKSKPVLQIPPKYGVGAGFKEFPLTDYRRKKMFAPEEFGDDDE